MKKSLILIFALLICLSACDKKGETSTPETSPLPTETPKITASQYPDKINETTYAGRLTDLTDTTITIIMDEKTTEVFNLNERAKRDIDILKIEVGNRIIIEFDSPETRNITSVQKIQTEL